MKSSVKAAILVLALLALSAPVRTQDAGQVLRLNVGFNTIKNSSKLTPEVQAEVERLSKLAQQENAAGKFSEAVKHLYHGISLMRGQAWTPTHALSLALTMKPDRVILEPGQSLRIRLGQIFALDEALPSAPRATVSLVSGNDGKQSTALKTVELPSSDLSASPATIEVTIPENVVGAHRLSVTLLISGAASSAEGSNGESVSKSTGLLVEPGITARLAAAGDRLQRVRSRLAGAERADLRMALPSAEYRVALFDLANKGEIGVDRLDLVGQLAEANRLLDEIEGGRNPFASAKGDIGRAYRSAVDDSLQPYRVFIPSSYDGSRAMPLIVALHGMGGDQNSYFDLYGNGAFKKLAEERGYVVVCPKGREPASMYVGKAEKDVMDVIAEVKRDFRIDPDRVYMTGHSMGGYGSWSIAMNHPEVFAAIAPVAGGGNPGGMPKIAHVPQLVVHGDDDKTVPVERSRVMVEAAKKAGVEVNYIEIPGGDHITIALKTFKEVFDWFDAHRRKPKARTAAAGERSTR